MLKSCASANVQKPINPEKVQGSTIRPRIKSGPRFPMTCNDAPLLSRDPSTRITSQRRSSHIHPPDSLVANLVAAGVKIMMVRLTRKASARDVPDD